VTNRAPDGAAENERIGNGRVTGTAEWENKRLSNCDIGKLNFEFGSESCKIPKLKFFEQKFVKSDRNKIQNCSSMKVTMLNKNDIFW